MGDEGRGQPVVTVLDQQYIVHVYAPADGPDAEAARRALRAIWRGCRLVFGMTEPVPGSGLPAALPPDAELRNAPGNAVLALQERKGADCQAVLRRYHDVLTLSVALAPPEARQPDGTEWPWWEAFEFQWNALTADHARYLLGEARLYLARVAELEPGRTAELSALLPEGVASTSPARTAGVALDRRVTIWEHDPQPEDRFLRRFIVAMSPDGDAAASAWAWSDGGTAIPPLARYLLHAAKLRYELRVWERDGQTRELRESLELLSSELTRLQASDAAKERLLRLRGHEATLLISGLGMLRRTVEIAVDNLGRCFNRSGLMAPDGPFADDAELGRAFLERLDDQLAYLRLRTDLANDVLSIRAQAPAGPAPDAEGPVRALRRPPGPATDAGPRAPDGGRAAAGADDTGDAARRVFVIHGRDDEARVAVFELLRAFALHPVEWDEFVTGTGEPMPFLGHVLEASIPLVQAVVVVMTPDDVVRLHPDLHGVSEPRDETGYAMQARPNVLIELGMALAVHPKRTVLLMFGDQRPIADIGGRNYVRIADGADFRSRLGIRLMLAGCPVQMPKGGGWETAGDFSSLAAYRRTPRPRPR